MKVFKSSNLLDIPAFYFQNLLQFFEKYIENKANFG